MATPAASASRGEPKRIAAPSSCTVPSSALRIPAMIRPSVLFPAPFSPQTARQDPAATSNDTPASAVMPGNRLTMPARRILGVSPAERITPSPGAPIMGAVDSRFARGLPFQTGLPRPSGRRGHASRQQPRPALIENDRDDHRPADDD